MMCVCCRIVLNQFRNQASVSKVRKNKTPPTANQKHLMPYTAVKKNGIPIFWNSWIPFPQCFYWWIHPFPWEPDRGGKGYGSTFLSSEDVWRYDVSIRTQKVLNTMLSEQLHDTNEVVSRPYIHPPQCRWQQSQLAVSGDWILFLDIHLNVGVSGSQI